jgi:hypothetical protein
MDDALRPVDLDRRQKRAPQATAAPSILRQRAHSAAARYSSMVPEVSQNYFIYRITDYMVLQCLSRHSFFVLALRNGSTWASLPRHYSCTATCSGLAEGEEGRPEICAVFAASHSNRPDADSCGAP